LIGFDFGNPFVVEINDLNLTKCGKDYLLMKISFDFSEDAYHAYMYYLIFYQNMLLFSKLTIVASILGVIRFFGDKRT